ncbi:MAG: DUF4381 domain-containing protein [Roseobacter sp.]
MSETPERPTNLVDLLDQLVLPPEPVPISMMPETVGWVVLGVCALSGICVMLWVWRKNRARNAYRSEALSALHHAGNDPAAVATVLRRCALAAYPRDEVAALSGEDWLSFLDRAVGGTVFSTGPGRALADAPYTSGGVVDLALIEAARHWIQAHPGART